MSKISRIDVSVGLFMLAGLLMLIIMAIKVSGLANNFTTNAGYAVTADFANIGGLKVRSPVTIAGVKIGEVTKIELQPEELNAKVTMRLYSNKLIPYADISARILTQGLLGANYISIVPGFEENIATDHVYLHDGDHIAKTQEAIILENLVGQLLFNIKK